MLFSMLIALLLPPPVGWIWHLVWCRIGRPVSAVASWAYSAAGGVAANLAGGQWATAAAGTVGLLVALAILWRRRRGRKRAPRAFGYKGRALLAALVASLRQSLRPRPVLRPQPGGAS
jgi:hypothetical protein